MVVLGLALSGLATVSAADAAPSPVSAQAASLTAEYTLYGDALKGWGFTPDNISNPGPTLTVAVGEVVTLNLIAHDAPTSHNWFIDFNDNSTPDPGEPSSLYFSSNTTPLAFTFIVPNNVGTYTYRCRVHPTAMTGQITITPAPTYVLWGDAVKGWGFGPNNITYPGPNLTVTQGERVILALYAHDPPTTHYFFVSYDGLQTLSAGEPRSPDFNSSIAPIIFEFTPSQSGNYTYYCGIHPTTMSGKISIVPSQGSTNTPPPPSNVETYAIVIILIVVLAVVVALLVRRRPKTPAPPPQEPPQSP